MATDKILPTNDAECLAYQYLHEGEERLPPDQQQSFIDQRQAPEREPEVPGEEPEEPDEQLEPLIQDVLVVPTIRRYSVLDDYPRDTIQFQLDRPPRRNPNDRVPDAEEPGAKRRLSEPVAIDVSMPTQHRADRMLLL